MDFDGIVIYESGFIDLDLGVVPQWNNETIARSIAVLQKVEKILN
jgi:hypothetical protein